MSFKEINPNEITKNPFDLIGKVWTLITAGNEQKFNTMTASWGSVGIMWNKPVAFIFIRPQRYTKEFVDTSEYFTMSFLPEDYRDALKFCGSKSGRDYDKAKETGLTPIFNESAPYFEQANMVFVCKKLYSQFLNKENVIENDVLKNYPENDFHEMYVAEIVKVLTK